MSEAARYSGPPDVGISREDRQAQEQFIQENLRRIFLQIYRIVGNVDDAQDLTCELAAGRKNERLGLKLAEVDARQTVERESSGLASTRL